MEPQVELDGFVAVIVALQKVLLEGHYVMALVLLAVAIE